MDARESSVMRVVLHVDLDSFYAQAEELRKPELRGKAVVVGMYSGRTENSGAVATANYAARALGIRAGMALSVAEKKGEGVVFLKADRPYYLEVSGQVMETLRGFADRFEQVSIDEASLEVTERCKGSFERAEKLAWKLKAAVLAEEGLTCSVGIGPNKLIAKMAAGTRKPDGLTIVKPAEVDEFLEPLPAGKLYGLGPKSEAVLLEEGVRTVRELRALSRERLVALFGGAKGAWFYNAARGVDESAVQEEPQKQVSRLCTLKADGRSVAAVWTELEPLIEDVAAKVAKHGLRFRNVGIIVIAGWEGVTRSHMLKEPTGDAAVLRAEARRLLEEYFKENPKARVRRIGVRIAEFGGAQEGAGLKKWLG